MTVVIFNSYSTSIEKQLFMETTNLLLGPIYKQRWIYSCCKQLMDRLIYAYGVHENLNYTLFRPFNWLGPKLDRIDAQKEGSSRVVTQFISNILHHGEIRLVNGGRQRRSFTYIDDGIEALVRIIENEQDCANRRIFNIGNPLNDISIRELAEMIVDLAKNYPRVRSLAEQVKIIDVEATKHYGEHYQDLGFRVPSIENARKFLNWSPKIDIRSALIKTLDYHFRDSNDELAESA